MKPELFDVAARCFASGQSLEPTLRRFRERQAARYFWQACGVLKPTRRNPHMHEGIETAPPAVEGTRADLGSLRVPSSTARVGDPAGARPRR